MMMGRPSRSDEHPAPEEEARIESETRDYFDEMAPKRHTKPSRSDPSSLYADTAGAASDAPIPEHSKFQYLEAHSQKILCEHCNGSKLAEEYVETEYYDDLNCMDKQHHTTGSGFIKMKEQHSNSCSNGTCFGIAANSDVKTNTFHHASTCSSSSNPATNDWIPSAQVETEIVASNKPKRSEN
ncbi:Maternal effect embryo arrest 59 [Rhynchospora pubera]|uniref:Maternal effect embryo arrest 59 n=1 Tax=Rhynchospora pubera TaxID=906938 RepID=A0AAV8CRX6_9POAL|nr:Maternal effect embryo arrest 59 [Rhynchospora pubera]